jgi:hypothetical protein
MMELEPLVGDQVVSQEPNPFPLVNEILNLK